MKKITSIYFYCCPPGSPEKAAFQQTIINLAEGLKDLGIDFYSNINYWRLTPKSDKFLFNTNPKIGPDDCDVVIINDVWLNYRLDIPKGLFHPKRKYITCYIIHVDYNNGFYNSSLKKEFQKIDLVLRCHYNNKFRYPANTKPWAFGLSKRIIEETKNSLPYSKRKKAIINNFRVPQQIRELANKFFIPLLHHQFSVDSLVDNFNFIPQNPYDRLMWQQTGRRHYPSYYEKLKNTALSSCFGGMFALPYPKSIDSTLFKIVNFWNLRTVKHALKTDTIIQFDNWRFWEALSAGTVALDADLIKYGAQLPIMPTNFKHYIGVDFDNIEKTYHYLKNNLDLLPYISTEGKKWALENYCPKAVAQRFLQYIYDFEENKDE